MFAVAVHGGEGFFDGFFFSSSARFIPASVMAVVELTVSAPGPVVAMMAVSVELAVPRAVGWMLEGKSIGSQLGSCASTTMFSTVFSEFAHVAGPIVGDEGVAGLGVDMSIDFFAQAILAARGT